MIKSRILVVDDDIDTQNLVQTLLEIEGYDVQTAANGQEALTTVSTTTIDLIILDVRLPGIDGYEVCRRLKSQPGSRSIPILMYSASFNHVEDKASEAGADDFIVKPFAIDALLLKVRENLEKQKT